VKAQRARMGAVGGFDMASAGPRIVMSMSGSGGGPGEPPPRGAAERRTQVEGSAAIAGMTPSPLQFVDPSELPDYRPPFLANASRADAQGNLWVRTTAAPTAPGALVYDVVNAKGELVERVQVPAGRQIVGFGPEGSVYLVAREGTGPTAVTTLERARVR
jgi:hypothetical protein